MASTNFLPPNLSNSLLNLGSTGGNRSVDFSSGFGGGGSTNAGQFAQNVFGGLLSPGQSFTSQLPMQDFLDPFEQFAGGFFDEFVTPEFNRFTRDPFLDQLRGDLAASGAGRIGTAQGIINRETDTLQRQLADQRSNLLSNVLRPILEREFGVQAEKNAQSPLQFINL